MSAATAVAVPLPQRAEQLQWLAPAPLWDDSGIATGSSGLTQPWIAELRTDTFVTDFLDLMGGRSSATPAGLADFSPHSTVGAVAGAPFRLFQPLSQCYYLVSASLVCRRPGIPDHAVRRAGGERTSFVLRLLGTDGTEQAWVPSGTSGTWVPATAGALAPGEETFPMHPVAVAGYAAAGTTAAALGMAAGAPPTRTVFYGYIAAGRREKLVPALADPVAALKAYDPSLIPSLDNPWLNELFGRVIAPWTSLNAIVNPQGPPPPNPPKDFHFPSLFLLLDLADWLNTYLPAVYQAILNPDPSSAPTGAQGDLLDLLQHTTVNQTKPTGAQLILADVLKSLDAYRPLVTGADIDGPTTKYDLSDFPRDSATGTARLNWFLPVKPNTPPSLADYVLAALEQAATDPGYQPQVPPELQGMIKIDPVSPPAGMAEPTYAVRAVFEHYPCRPVLGAQSHPFVLARAVDPDAPARKIRIPLPDIANLRRFQRGVALEMPPSVRKVVDAVTPDVLKGSGVADHGAQLGMICSFSLQIIFLCAFIVLFVFLLLLNIVFWWMPFLKICFPIPVKPGTPKAPQP